MDFKGFVGFIKSIFVKEQTASGPKQACAGSKADFSDMLRRETMDPNLMRGDADPRATPVRRLVSQPKTETAPVTEPPGHLLLGKKIHTGKKFFPLKAYRQASLKPARTRSKPEVLPLVQSSGYPLRVSNSVALNRFHQTPPPVPSGRKNIGQLSARFESGERGVGAVGYDPSGGTSYGVYQIASRPGSMGDFIKYLKRKQPDWAQQLETAGPADTGSNRGAMPGVWKQIAGENPKRFEQLQRDFIRTHFHGPAAKSIYNSTGLDVNNRSQALQEVLWSTAVQHGVAGAHKIFSKAVRQLELRGRDLADNDLIQRIYRIRAEYTGGLSAGLKASVEDRFREERSMALSMLRNRNFRA